MLPEAASVRVFELFVVGGLETLTYTCDTAAAAGSLATSPTGAGTRRGGLFFLMTTEMRMLSSGTSRRH